MSNEVKEAIKARSRKAMVCAMVSDRMKAIADGLTVRGDDKTGCDIKSYTAILSPHNMPEAMAEFLRRELHNAFQTLAHRYEEFAQSALALHHIDHPIAEYVEPDVAEELKKIEEEYGKQEKQTEKSPYDVTCMRNSEEPEEDAQITRNGEEVEE